MSKRSPRRASTAAPKTSRPSPRAEPTAFRADDVEITGKPSHTIHDEDPRNTKSPHAPKEPRRETIEPSHGPNRDGIDQQLALAHAPGEEEFAKRARGFEARHEPAAREED